MEAVIDLKKNIISKISGHVCKASGMESSTLRCEDHVPLQCGRGWVVCWMESMEGPPLAIVNMAVFNTAQVIGADNGAGEKKE